MDGSTPQTFPFLKLPYHLRHDIYTLALDYPDLNPVFARIECETEEDEEEHEKTKLPKCVLPTPHVPEGLKTTPGIMLCCKQTAWEAREAMNFKTFTLRRPPTYTTTLGRPMDITEFISEDTLKGMRRVNFVMNLYKYSTPWLKTVETLLDVWSIETHLRRIEITIKQPSQLRPGQFWHQSRTKHAIRTLSMVSVRAFNTLFLIHGHLGVERGVDVSF